MVVSGAGDQILLQSETLLSHLDKFALDLFKVTGETYDFLEACQAGDIVEVGLVINEEVAHLIRLLLYVLAEEDADPIV